MMLKSVVSKLKGKLETVPTCPTSTKVIGERHHDLIAFTLNFNVCHQMSRDAPVLRLYCGPHVIKQQRLFTH